MIAMRFNSTSLIGTLIADAAAAEIAKAKAKIDAIGNEARICLNFIDRIDLKAGELGIRLNHRKIATFFERNSNEQLQDLVTIQAPFQIRKRGVETKLIFADAPRGRDEKLIKNIAKAHHWFEQIKAGKTFSQIAASDQTSKRRIQ